MFCPISFLSDSCGLPTRACSGKYSRTIVVIVIARVVEDDKNATHQVNSHFETRKCERWTTVSSGSHTFTFPTLDSFASFHHGSSYPISYWPHIMRSSMMIRNQWTRVLLPFGVFVRKSVWIECNLVTIGFVSFVRGTHYFAHGVQMFEWESKWPFETRPNTLHLCADRFSHDDVIVISPWSSIPIFVCKSHAKIRSTELTTKWPIHLGFELLTCVTWQTTWVQSSVTSKIVGNGSTVIRITKVVASFNLFVRAGVSRPP